MSVCYGDPRISQFHEEIADILIGRFLRAGNAFRSFFPGVFNCRAHAASRCTTTGRTLRLFVDAECQSVRYPTIAASRRLPSAIGLTAGAVTGARSGDQFVNQRFRTAKSPRGRVSINWLIGESGTAYRTRLREQDRSSPENSAASCGRVHSRLDGQ